MFLLLAVMLPTQLHQKMDSIAFTQERMKRQVVTLLLLPILSLDLFDLLLLLQLLVLLQVDALQERVAGAPSDIGDIRDRMEVGRRRDG